MSGTKSLLFVDDEEEILDILKDLFAEEEYNLYTATKVQDAIEIIKENNVDFVLSDLKLPDSSGVTFLEKVKNMNPEAVRVLTSGYLDVGFGLIAKDETSGTLLISKPWNLETIRQLVTREMGA